MKCRVCKCTQERACDNGCGWFAPGLCTTCARMVDACPSPEETRAVVGALVLLLKLRSQCSYGGRGFLLLTRALHRLNEQFWHDAGEPNRRCQERSAGGSQ